MLLEFTVVVGPGLEDGTRDAAAPGGVARDGVAQDGVGPLVMGSESEALFGTCWSGVGRVELTATWPAGSAADCSGASLANALGQHWPGRSFTVAGLPLESLQAGAAPLVPGAVVVTWPRAGERPAMSMTGIETSDQTGIRLADMPAVVPGPRKDGTAALLAICAGPGAGAVLALHRGEYSIGRGQCRIQIADPALSRRHGTLVVGAQTLTLSPAKGSSGFTVRQGRSCATAQPVHVRGPVTLMEGTIIGCGSSLLELRIPGLSGDDATAATALRSGPASARLLDPAALEPLVIAVPSGRPGGRWAMVVAGTLPLALGVGLAMATGSLMFLAFSAMGAVTVLAPLLGGSRRRRTFREAVRAALAEDAARQARTFPDAATLVVDFCRGGAPPRGEGPSGQSLGLALRLGTAAQAARVVVSPHDPSFTAPLIPAVPACVSLEAGAVTINGPEGPVQNMLHFVLMQLDAAAVPVVVLGRAGSFPLSARFLPHTALVASVGAAVRALEDLCHGAGSQAQPTVLICVEMPLVSSPLAVPGLRQLQFASAGANAGPDASSAHARSAATGPASAQKTPQVDSAASITVSLEATGNSVAGSVAGQSFVPDGVPGPVFDSYARRRASQEAPSSMDVGDSMLATTLPLPGRCTAEALVHDWAVSRGGPLRPIPLGWSADGATMLDLRRDGPHLLVGGSTGSGKSEFLRTLVGSLAAAHSPADLHFVFIDFKGGAGLGVLCKLPHTSSLITDLGGEGMERTLASLRAELHRREAALAEAEASDADECRAMATGQLAVGAQQDGARTRGAPRGRNPYTMAHLLVVVDEFRVLVDQFPDALKELMRIAAVGRSLGMHLVMATQRPQGALNADIRANVTSSICLRVQSAFDSTDVIGTGAAASISVSTPGRAFISRAGASPEEFQSSTLRLPARPSGEWPRVELAEDSLPRDGQGGAAAFPGGALRPGELADHGSSDVESVAALMHEAWRQFSSNSESRLQAAPAVVAPELPVSLVLGNECRTAGLAEADWVPDAAPGTGRRISPTRGQGVVLGIVDVPEHQSLEPLLWKPDIHSHLACFGTATETSSVISLVAGQLLEANAGAHCGSEPTLLYLLDGDGSLSALAGSPWVGSHVAADQLRTAARLVARLAEVSRTSSRKLVLGISDWGRWTTALRNSPWHGTEDGIAELIRFGGQTLAVIVGGGRELLSSSFLPSIPNRAFLRHGSSSESAALWPRLPAFSPVAGRGAIAGPLNAAATHGAAEAMHVAQFGKPESLGSRVGAAATATAGTAAAKTLQVVSLPTVLTLPQMERTVLARPVRGANGLSLMLGLGGDGMQPVGTVLAPGAVMPVTGSPGSGKSSFLRAMVALNGGTALNPASLLPPAPEAGQLLWLDDAATLSPGQLAVAGQWLEAGGAIVAAFDHPGPALSRLPLDWGLRSALQGVVLMPQRPGDAELLGVRLDTVGGEPPGRAVLIERGRIAWFQFPQLMLQYPGEIHGPKTGP